eukprot:CAMPEP_0175050852 /NCGR_PEP_ID=MMETSP0052_2-20121109/7477_1 /TAXON_ID=51329 ORGANISM="Polytomella parva, Strain SAG 63-3" /NCGR_SAMPLE_ID=MMETSP0052_2 /ASSEMBLY_ACC=CAM_ASM_000194 /LENGTH=724 /DNA_ID=CAMNT_0016315077 /DNA_START=265 /DNA_END=2440 /DNA_ORIENTATION=+
MYQRFMDVVSTIERSAADGSPYHLVMLDTEGIDAYDQTAQYSTQIFSLAVLLSSLFLYNQMGGIDESALDRLSLVTEMTKHIRVKAGEGEDRIGEFSPSFLWLLRDFYLRLEEDGRKITAKDYLESALLPVAGGGASVEAKNQIRSSIKSLFPDRDCFALVRPVHEESTLSALDRVPSEQLRPEFRDGVAQLIRRIFDKALPKRFGSQLMTGPVLAGLITAYVGAINKGAVPTIATAWQGVAEAECRRASDAAEEAYVKTFRGDVRSEVEELEAEHKRALGIAKAVYRDMCVGDVSIKSAHEQRFMEFVENRFRELSTRKLAEAAAKVNEQLYKANVAMSKVATSGNLSLEELQQQMQHIVAQFAESAEGPTKWERLSEFLMDTWPAIASQTVSQQQRRAEVELDALHNSLAQMEAAAAAANDRGVLLERDLAESTEEAAALRQQLTSLRAERNALRGNLEAEGQRVAALTKLLEEQKSRASELDTSLRAQSRRVDELSAALAAQASRAGTAEATLTQKQQRLTALEAQVKEVLVISERKQAGAAELAEAKVKEAESEFESRVADLMAQLTAERVKSGELTADLATHAARVQALEARLAAAAASGEEWREKYNREAFATLALRAERDESRDAVAIAVFEKDAAVRDRDAVLGRLQALEAKMESQYGERKSLQYRLDELVSEAQAARAAAYAPPSSIRISYESSRLAAQASAAAAFSAGGVAQEL